jgi:hypothetical protein
VRQSFSVISPASQLSILTDAQLRAAAGLDADDDSRDTELRALGAALSSDIAVACNVVDDGVNPPTLLQETVTETFWVCDRPPELFLSRRFVSSVTSVTEAGSTLTSSDHVLDAGAGLLNRVSGGRPWSWYTGEVSLTYIAGFAAAPPDLAAAAFDLAKIRLSYGSRDPLVKSESIEVPDIETRRLDFWVGALPGAAASPVPPEILSRLSRYMNVFIA